MLAVAVLVLALVVLAEAWWDEARVALLRADGWVFFSLLCLLPVFGFSVALMYVVVGARFGGPLGLVVVAGATVFHLAASHLVARSFLRAPVERLLRGRRHRLPDLAREAPVSCALLGALLPGPPYLVRNYALALSGVPFRIYAPICWPVYVIRSGVAIYLGDWAADLSARRVLILAGVLVFNAGVCAAIVWHLRRRHRLQAGAAGGPPA